jgi:thymidylate synthase (FAD)
MFTIEFPEDAIEKIAKIGHVCYNSPGRGDDADFVRRLVDSGHHSVLEHCSVTATMVVSRAIADELLRHRLVAATVQSTRYCEMMDYVVSEELPEKTQEMIKSVLNLEMQLYQSLLKSGLEKQVARSVLPMAVATKMVLTANLREWMHIIRLRTGRGAHPEMIELMKKLEKEFVEWCPEIFERRGSYGG